MKLISALLIPYLFAATAQAATTPRLNQGDWIVGGATSLTFASGSSSTFTITPEFEYFVIDNIALGLNLAFQAQSGFTYFAGGPEITFHMRASETIIPYLTIVPISVTTYTGGHSYNNSQGLLGVKFFLTDSVAFGPAVRWTHYWPQNGRGGGDSGAVLGVFSLHI